MESSEHSSRSVRDWLYLLFRNKVKIFAVLFTVVLIVTIVSFLTPYSYRSSAKILVKFGRENVYTNSGSSAPVADPIKEEQIRSEVEILKARSLAEKVLQCIGVEKIYPQAKSTDALFGLSNFLPAHPVTPLQKATLEFQRKLRVEGVKKSNIIQLTFEHTDPILAARIINELIDEFVAQHVSVYKNPQTSTFFDDQTQALRKNLQGSEARLQEFRSRNNISALQEQKVILLRQISDTELELGRVRAEVSENRGRIESLRRSRDSQNAAGFGKETDFNLHVISALKNSLSALKLREQELRSKYSEENYLVVAIRNEIKTAEKLLAEEERTYHNKEVTSIEQTMTALQQKENIRKNNLSTYRADIQRINNLENELKKLERQAKLDEENYLLYAKKAEEGRLSEAMDTQKMANISIVQPGMVPIHPAKPNIPLNILLSFIVGGFMSVGVAYASESLSRTFNTVEDVKRHLGIGVLAAVNEMDQKRHYV